MKIKYITVYLIKTIRAGTSKFQSHVTNRRKKLNCDLYQVKINTGLDIYVYIFLCNNNNNKEIHVLGPGGISYLADISVKKKHKSLDI